GRASDDHAALIVFPELGLSGYSIEDLHHQQALLDGVLDALESVRAASRELAPVVAVGAPLRIDGLLYNTAVLVHRGRLLGVVVKSYLPEHWEFYEKRQFRAARDLLLEEFSLLGEGVPCGSRLLFTCTDVPGFSFHVEI